ncbi:MAG: long-chain fatty acid--CoA ligase, partial [Sphingomonadaceae bacterium]|nr:long-chain fatty acid--CoA ligase [Sphingomonadaceae bacterium]
MTTVRRISDALKIRAEHQRDQIAHDDTRRQITFAQWDREANEIGGGLAAAGLKPGDRVFLPISNAYAVEMAIAVFAIFRAGGIVCPINPRLSPAEVFDYKDLCEPRWCIADGPDLVKDLKFDGCWTVDQMPRDISALPDQDSLDADADAEILGTSGTTGKIKGVVVSHPDLISRGVTGVNMDSTRSTLNALPLTGSAGNLGIVMLPVRGGATAITQRKFDPKGFLELVREKQPDLVYLVPSMLRLILDHPDAGDYDFAGVKYLMTGTAPLPHDSVVRAMANWPHLRIRNNYGMSEGGVVVGTTSAAQALKPGCVGKMPEHMQLRGE